MVTLIHGECIEEMRQLPEASVDSVVTDPPYGLGFMGKQWDALPPGLEWAAECLRVLKPGGHLLAFGGTRTWHRLAVAVEDAGFEIRDSIAWMYGSGFPKSLDVSKAIDKAAGAEREVISTVRRSSAPAHIGNHTSGERSTDEWRDSRNGAHDVSATAPATDAARQWSGWGTALKPAFEPIVVARKPLSGTVAANVLAHGTGALNIDGCRIGTEERVNAAAGNKPGGASYNMSVIGMPQDAESRTAVGRWPANVVLDESQAAELDKQSGTLTSGTRAAGTYRGIGYQGSDSTEYPSVTGDSGGASRFFYCAKAPKKERPVVNGVAHPTVKPLALMRYLVKLVTPPGGIVLEPFAGSGATVEAAILEGFDCIAIEREPEYLPLIQSRIDRSLQETLV